MLILTRKTNQSIQIGDDIELKVLDIDGDQVKLGIDAPKHVDIHRKEIYVTIQEENQKAADAPVDLVSQLLDKSEKDS